MDGSLFFYNAAWPLSPSRLGVSLDQIQPLDSSNIFVWDHLKDLTGLAPFSPSDHHDTVVLTDVHKKAKRSAVSDQLSGFLMAERWQLIADIADS